MKAMVLEAIGQPLRLRHLPDRRPGDGEIRLALEACAVCRTDLHVVDGDLPQPHLPLIPGHEIVGIVDALGPGVDASLLGRRVGVLWLGGVCGHCEACTSSRENFCDHAIFTGYSRDGGFATQVVATADFAFPLDGFEDPVSTAPLLCAGLIGWRSLRMAGAGRAIGLFGFGAAAHILTQICRWQGRDAFAFVRKGDDAAAAHAKALGCVWAGSSDEAPPHELDAAIVFAPVGELVPKALAYVRKGGTVVCGGIHMSDIPAFPYRLLWGERIVRSVANLTRKDAIEFLAVAAAAKVRTRTTVYPLEHANDALSNLRNGRFQGAAVLVP